MQGLCAEKKAIGTRKRLNYITLQSIADKESANRGRSRPPTGIGLDTTPGLRTARFVRCVIRPFFSFLRLSLNNRNALPGHSSKVGRTIGISPWVLDWPSKGFNSI